MADSDTVDTTQQVTSQSPKKHEKKPKRVAAGKAIIEKTRLAREVQKKANAIISKNNIQTPKAANEAPEAATIQAPEANNIQDADSETILTTTQWLSVFSIFISIVGIYYKREEIKALFVKKRLLARGQSIRLQSIRLLARGQSIRLLARGQSIRLLARGQSIQFQIWIELKKYFFNIELKKYFFNITMSDNKDLKTIIGANNILRARLRMTNKALEAANEALVAATIQNPEANNIKDADPKIILATNEIAKMSMAATTTKWLMALSLFLSIFGIYYEREEIKAKKRLIDICQSRLQSRIDSIQKKLDESTPPRHLPVTNPVNPKKVRGIINMD